jgi:hypothetical protein
MGGTHLHFVDTVRTATLVFAGGTISKWAQESPTFAPRVKASLMAGGLVPDSYSYNLYFRDIQAVIDSGDPINHIKDTVSVHPVHLMKVLNDQVVPNVTTDRLIAQGPMRKLKTIGPNAVSAGNAAYTFFSKGDHGSILSPAASPAATVEMQKQSVLFVSSAVQAGGPFVVLTDPTVLDLN